MNLTSHDSRGRLFSVSELTTFFEAQAERDSKIQRRLNKVQDHWTKVLDAQGCTGQHKNDEISKLKDGHLVTDRRKLFEKNRLGDNKNDTISDTTSETKVTTPDETPKRITSCPAEVVRRLQEEKSHRSFEEIQNFRRSVMDTIIKYIQEGVSEDEEEDRSSSPPIMSENEVEECESMMRQLPSSWTYFPVSARGEDLGAKDADDAGTEIARCMEEVSGEFSELVALTEREDASKVKTTKSGSFVKSNRSSSKRKKMKKTTEDVVYSYERVDSDDSVKTEGDPDGMTSFLDGNSFAYACDESDDIFGAMTALNDFIVEAYNSQEDEVLYKLTLKREPISVPDKSVVQKSTSESKSPDIQIEVTVNCSSQHQVSYVEDENHRENDGDTDESIVEYVNVTPNINGFIDPSCENVIISNKTDRKQNNIYENWVVFDKTLEEGSYYDKDDNPRITITCESKPPLESRNLLEEPKRIESQLSLPAPKKQHIIDELRVTERKYLDGLEYMIHEYLKHFTNHPAVRQIGMGIRQIFGNIEDIFKATQDFYAKLLDCGYSVECIARLFLENEKLFLLCSDYMRNKSKTQHIYDQYNGALSDRQKQLNDKKTCDSYLLTPVQRPTRYKLLLENLSKDLKKHGEHCSILEEAIAFVDRNISEANKLLAIDSIRGCPLDLTDQGPLLLKDCFSIKRKYKSYIFLFRDVVVFTTENKVKQDTFDYKDSILSTDLSLKHQTNSCTFVLINFPKCKKETSRFDDGVYSFEIEATNPQVCTKWVDEIRNILWLQLNNFKDLQTKKGLTENQSSINDQKPFSTLPFTEKRKKNTRDRSRSSIFYISSDCQ